MLTIGTKLGHYEILSKLGAGGMGEVFRAKDLQLGREVAIKVLLSRFAESSEFLARFERESKALAALSHPNVLTIHEFFSQGSSQFIVMELLEGETLRHRLKRSELSWQKKLAIGTAIAEGLAAAHSKGIVHRDIKPENIFLTSDGRTKILDFGLAKQHRQAESILETEPFVPELTDTGVVLGTHGYMSPEQIRCQYLDARSDIFSLGCVLYEMASGKRPFHRDTVVDTMSATLNDDAAVIANCKSDVIAMVEPIIRRCLEKNPDERFQDAKDLGFALRNIFESPTVKPHVSTYYSQYPFRTWLAICFLVLTTVFATTYSINRWFDVAIDEKTTQSEAPHRFAVMPVVNETGDPELDRVSEFLCEDLINRLSVRSMDVKSIHVVSAYKDKHANIQEVGRQLEVETLIVVRLRRQQDHLEASVSLLHVDKGTNLWGDRYPFTLAELSNVAGRIARKVVDRLPVTVTTEEAMKLERRLTENPEAMRLYLEGRSMFATGQRTDVYDAIDRFQRAAKEDQRFALPHLGIASAYYWLSSTHEAPNEVMPKAKAAAVQALQLDDSLGEAYALLGFIKAIFDWEWTESEQDFQRALDRSPKSANVHTYFGLYLAQRARFDDAIYQLQMIRELDPWTPEIVGYPALGYYFAGRHDRAIQELESTLVRSPKSYSLYAYLGLNYERKAELAKAIQAFEKVREMEPNPDGLGQLGHAYALAGREQDAISVREELLRLSKDRYVSSYNFALIHAALGDVDKAIESLQIAADERADWIACLKVDPRFQHLKNDPRFSELLDRVNLN